MCHLQINLAACLEQSNNNMDSWTPFQELTIGRSCDVRSQIRAYHYFLQLKTFLKKGRYVLGITGWVGFKTSGGKPPANASLPCENGFSVPSGRSKTPKSGSPILPSLCPAQSINASIRPLFLHFPRYLSVPYNIKVPVKLKLNLIVVVDEGSDSVVDTLSENSRGCSLFGKAHGVDRVQISVWCIWTNHSFIL